MRATEALTRQEEQERERRFPTIEFADSYSGRVARLRGRGIKVWQVIRALRSVDGDVETLLQVFDYVPPELVLGALEYYKAYPEAIDDKLREEDEISIEQFWKDHPWSKPAWR